jgi:hypothetical protein
LTGLDTLFTGARVFTGACGEGKELETGFLAGSAVFLEEDGEIVRLFTP